MAVHRIKIEKVVIEGDEVSIQETVYDMWFFLGDNEDIQPFLDKASKALSFGVVEHTKFDSEDEAIKQGCPCVVSDTYIFQQFTNILDYLGKRSQAVLDHAIKEGLDLGKMYSLSNLPMPTIGKGNESKA